MPTRRSLVLGGAAALGAAAVVGAGWTLAWEPALRLRVVRHRVASPAWPRGLAPVTIALVADPHLGPPHTPPERLARVVAQTNSLEPDMVALLGDYVAHHRYVTRRATIPEAAGILAGLAAPLGVHAVLGNHDWWDDEVASRGPGAGSPAALRNFAAAGLPVLHNAARPLAHGGARIWVAGLGSQWAYRRLVARGIGADDLGATLAAVPAGEPVILLAHEPDIFPRVPARVALTLSGHTHGGQVRLAGWSPYVPSRFGNRYAWGHVEEEGRHLVVSGGIGQSILPVRLGMPSEITMVTLGPA